VDQRQERRARRETVRQQRQALMAGKQSIGHDAGTYNGGKQECCA
jgi:hypothetical protein